MPDLPSLLHKAREVSSSLRETVSRTGHILIVSRPTADGIASASMLASALLDLGAQFTIKYIDMVSALPESLADFSADRAVLIGLGEELSSKISGLLRMKIDIIDHHSYLGDVDGVIASKYGFNGALDVSSSTLTYLVMKEVVENPVKYACLALVGSLGEHQDLCQRRSLCGLNEEVLREATNAELIELKERPLFPRLYNLPLHESIALSIDPLIQGLSGEPDTVRAVLEKAGIRLTRNGRWRTYEDLSKDERELLIDTIEPYLIIGGRKAGPIIAASFSLVKEDEHVPLKDGRDYAHLLEASSSEPALGTVVAMGKRGREVIDAAERMNKYLMEVISAAKSLLYDERRLRLFEGVAVLMGEGVVNYKVANAVSYVASRLPTLSPYITILKTTLGAEGIVILRKGSDVKDDRNLYEIAANVSKHHNAKAMGHEAYALIISSLIKQSTIIRELRKALEA